MSAWIVSKGHVDALVQQMIVDGLITLDQADATGKMLWDENHYGVNVRYRGHEPTPDYKFEGVEARLDDIVILAQIHCLNYQCAEWQGYENQPGMQLIKRLRTRICDRHGVEPGDVDSDYHLWRDAPWGIDSIEEAIAQSEARP